MNDHAGYWIDTTVQDKCEHVGERMKPDSCPYCRVEELEARLMLKTRRGKSHAALLERNATLERVREAAIEWNECCYSATWDAEDKLREALAACEDKDND